VNLELRQHRLAPLITVTVAALVFAILLIAVRLQWAPLESADHGAAADINSLIAGNATLVTAVKAVTWLGSNGVLWTVIGAATVILAIRQRWRLAAYLLVTGAGALILDPILKSLVGRLRPVVAHPIAHGTGNSFPSGHSLGSIVCYGAILLVFLPAARGRWRTAFVTVIVALIALIGISRILLGVHYLSDVVGAWAVGVTWLGVTAFAFELTRSAAGRPVTDPVTEGLEPEARADLKPARPEPAAGPPSSRHYGRIAAAVVVAWVLILGIIVGLGELITRDGNGNILGDRTIPRWFAAHRAPSWTHWSLIFSTLGATQAILIVALATCVVFLAVTRHWRPVIFVATVMFGELGAFLAAAAVVKTPQAGRHPPRPAPAHLGLPVRARGRHVLSLRRRRDPGHRPRPRLVAMAVPDPRDRHARPRRVVPHIPRRAPSHRHPRVLRALARAGAMTNRVRGQLVNGQDYVVGSGFGQACLTGMSLNSCSQCVERARIER
jgi:undecaprenyl-diphosphatase